MIQKMVIGLLSLTLLVVTPMVVIDHQTLQSFKVHQTEVNRVVVGTLVKNRVPSFLDIRKVTKRIYLENLGNGSGVMIAPRRMLTAAHVARMHSDTSPLMVDGKPIVKVLKINDELDLALLEVDIEGPYVSIGTMPGLDEKVYMVGYPSFDSVNNEIVTEGRVMGMSKDRRIIATTPASPGNSGGGLFRFHNDKWELVGVLIEIAGTSIGGMFPAMVYHLSRSVDPDTIKEFLNEFLYG